MDMHECNGNMRMQRTHENSVGRQECNGRATDAFSGRKCNEGTRIPWVLENAIGP